MRKRFAILSFSNETHLEAARDTPVQLGNTTLTWHNLKDSICAVCLADDHIAKGCPEKAKRAERAKAFKQNHQKYQHLYQKYQPARTSAIQKFLTNTQQFRNKSFAQVTINKPNVNSSRNNPHTTQAFTNPVAYLKNDQANTSLTTVLKAIHQLGEEISTIKKLLTDMDSRISNIETDAYWYHTTKDEDQIIVTEYPTEVRSSTPPTQTTGPEDSFSNYQRKRQALSPADDLRNQQNLLHNRIDTMGNTLEQVASTLNEFTTELFSSQDSVSSNIASQEQIDTNLFGDQTPTEEIQ
jgi:hypothetical protein